MSDLTTIDEVLACIELLDADAPERTPPTRMSVVSIRRTWAHHGARPGGVAARMNGYLATVDPDRSLDDRDDTHPAWRRIAAGFEDAVVARVIADQIDAQTFADLNEIADIALRRREVDDDLTPDEAALLERVIGSMRIDTAAVGRMGQERGSILEGALSDAERDRLWRVADAGVRRLWRSAQPNLREQDRVWEFLVPTRVLDGLVAARFPERVPYVRLKPFY